MRKQRKSAHRHHVRNPDTVPLEIPSQLRWRGLLGSEYLELMALVERSVRSDIECKRLLPLDPKAIMDCLHGRLRPPPV